MLLDRSSELDLEQGKAAYGWMKFSALVSYPLLLNFFLMAIISGAQVLNQDVQVSLSLCLVNPVSYELALDPLILFQGMSHRYLLASISAGDRKIVTTAKTLVLSVRVLITHVIA